MAATDDLVISIKAKFIDDTADGLKKTQKQVDNLTESIEDFDKTFKKLDGKKSTPTLSLRDQAISKLDATAEKLKAFDNKTATARLSATDSASSIVNTAYNNLKLFGARSASATLKVTDLASTAISNVVSNLKSATSKSWDFVLNAIDKVTSPLRSAYNWLTSIQGIVTTIFAGQAIKSTIFDPVGLADFYTTAEIGFSTMLGSAEAAQNKMNEIKEFAMITPFKTKGLVDTTQKMLAMGWESERLIPDLEKIGNAMAALGKGDEGIERTTLALSQMQAKGKVSAEEMRQLTEVGLPAWKYLADAVGVTTSEAQDMVSKGLIPINEAMDAIIGGMNQFDGMMDKTANETVSGLLSQIQDIAEINIFAPWGEGLQDGVKPHLTAIKDLLSDVFGSTGNIKDTLYDIGYTISNNVMAGVEGITRAFSSVFSNPDFQSASFGKKVEIFLKEGVEKPLGQWWQSGGKDTVTNIAKGFMEVAGGVIKEGVPVLLEAAFSNPITGTIAAGYGLSIANSLLGGLVGGMGKTKSAISNVITIGRGLSNLKNVGLGGFTSAVKEAGSLTGALKTLGQAGKAVSSGLSSAVSGASSLATTVSSAATASGGLMSTLAAFTPIALGVAAAVGVVAYGIYQQRKRAEELIKPYQEIIDKTKELTEETNGLNDSIKNNIENRKKSIPTSLAEAAQAQGLTNAIFNLTQQQKLNAEAQDSVVKMVSDLNDILPDLNLTYDTTTGALYDNTGAVISNKDAINERIVSLEKEARAEAARSLITEAYKDQLEAEQELVKSTTQLQQTYNELNILQRELVKESEKAQPNARRINDLLTQIAPLKSSYDELSGSVGALRDTYNQTTDQISYLSEVAYGVSGEVVQYTSDAMDEVDVALSKLPQSASENFDRLKNVIIVTAEEAKSYWNSVFNDINSGMSAIDTIIKNDATNGSGGINNVLLGQYSMHASGGIMDSPHLGLVAEDGPEAIIPLGNKRRSRGVSLWKEAGRRLGVYAHAEGGISSGSSSSPSVSGGGTLEFEVDDNYTEAISSLNSFANSYNSTTNSIESTASQKFGNTERITVDSFISSGAQIESLLSKLTMSYTSYSGNALSIFTAMYTSYVNMTQAQMNNATNIINTTLNTQISVISSFSSKFNQQGVSLMTEFQAGLDSKRNDVIGSASTLVTMLKDAFESGLGIHSPSRYMKWVGEMMMAGFIGGMSGSDLNRFIESIIGDMQSSFSNGAFSASELVNFLSDDSVVSLMGRITGLDTSGISDTISYPLSGGPFDITSFFGLRDAPTAGASTNHGALDFGAPTGTPILSILPGTVTIAGSYAGYGNAVKIDHGGGLQSLYGHMSSVGTSVGATVGKGQQIGLVGSTGISTGPHLHLEMIQDGSKIDPLPYIQGSSIVAGNPLVSAIQQALNVKQGIGTLSAYNPNGGAEQWRSTVQTALSMLGQSTSLTDAVLYAIQSESGGNPNAINDWDSNAMRGDPSRGLLQTIGSTFNAYRNPTLSDNIYDPLSNIYAGLNYMIGKYGSIANVVNPRYGHWYGYHLGTDNAEAGLKLVGENGPELIDFSGGERVYNHDQSRKILNSTGSVIGEPFGNSNSNTITIENGAIQLNINVNGSVDDEAVEKINANVNDQIELLARNLRTINDGRPINGGLA